MRRTLWFSLGAALLAVTVSAAVAASASRSAASTSIHVVFTGGPGAVLNFNGREFTIGDRLFVRGALHDPNTDKRVGTTYLECRVVTEHIRGGTFWCSYLLDLGKGTITTEGLDPQGESDTIFAITGGTGVYSGASGEAEYVDSNTQTDIYINLQQP